MKGDAGQPKSRLSWLRSAAAVVSIFTGLGFGVPGLIGTFHFIRTGKVWTFLGFPTYGGGPFERIGLDTSGPLLSAFLAVCAAEVALGVLLWRRWRPAPALSYALLPLEFVFWVGFALPFGAVLGITRAILLAAANATASSTSSTKDAKDS